MSTRFEYAPWAVCSSTSIWICGAAESTAPFGLSAMATVYTSAVSRRVLAVDLGARRIGVAVTDGLGLTAQPLATIARHGGHRDLDALATLVREHDAERIFDVQNVRAVEPVECISGQILKGLAKPPDCAAFGSRCTPEMPLGATMVSAEGACAAYYHYGRHLVPVDSVASAS